MAAEDKLYNLIHSLTQSEKRYFKRYCALYSDSKQNKYLRLFDIMDSVKKFDSFQIDKKVTQKKLSKGLNTTKSYLYKMILRSMRLYHEKRSKENGLVYDIQDAKFLINKSLFKEAVKLLNNITNESKAEEKSLLALNALYMLRNLQGSPYEVYSDAKCKDIYAAQTAEIEKYKNLCDFLKLEGIYKSIVIKKTSEINNADYRFFQNLPKNKLIRNVNEAKSDEAKLLHYYINIHSKWVTGDFFEYYKYCKSIINEVYGIKLNDENKIMDFAKFIRNVNLSASICGDYALAQKMITILKNIPVTYNLPAEHIVTNFCNINYYKILVGHFYYTCRFNQVYKSIGEQKKYLNKAASKHGNEDIIDCCFMNAIMLFINKDYSAALSWLNRYLDNSESANYRTDLISVSKVIKLLSHYELGSGEYVEYLVNTTHNYFMNQNDPIILHFRVLTKHFKKLVIAEDEAYKKSILKEIKSGIKQVLQDSPYKLNIHRERLFNISFVLNWIDAKLEDIDFADVLKRKAAIVEKYLKENG